MKVLIHAPNLDTPGGKQTFFQSVRKCYTWDNSFFFYGAQGQVESRPKWLRRIFNDYVKFYRRIKKENFDLVHLNPSLNPKSFFRDAGFMLICTWLRVRSVVFWHGWNWGFESKVVARILPFFRYTYGKSDAMIVLASEFERQLISYGFQGPIYLGTTVVDDIFLEDREDLRRSNSTEKTILFLARVEREKGIFEVIDSFRELQARYQDLHLVVAGVGNALEPAQEYVKELGAEGIEFKGWITGADKVSVFRNSDIYVLPSSHGEGMPMSILEAMASGLAVVTSDVGGIKDFFIEKDMGYIVRPHDTSDLTEKLDALLCHPAQMSKMGSFNIEYARHHFSSELVTEKLERIYEATVTGSELEMASRS